MTDRFATPGDATTPGVAPVQVPMPGEVWWWREWRVVVARVSDIRRTWGVTRAIVTVYLSGDEREEAEFLWSSLAAADWRPQADWPSPNPALRIPNGLIR